jgi:DNA-binding MarR family transcriptional regulator
MKTTSFEAGSQAGARPPMAGNRADPQRFDLQVLQALRRIIRAVDLHSRKLWKSHRITGPQLVCLLAIQELQPVIASAVARHVHLSPSTLVGILDRLQARGLVARRRDTRDRRLVFLSLTDTGSQLLRDAPSPLQDRLAEALRYLDPSEQGMIAASLERIVELMAVGKVDAAPILETGPIESEADLAEMAPPTRPGSPTGSGQAD